MPICVRVNRNVFMKIYYILRVYHAVHEVQIILNIITVQQFGWKKTGLERNSGQPTNIHAKIDITVGPGAKHKQKYMLIIIILIIFSAIF